MRIMILIMTCGLVLCLLGQAAEAGQFEDGVSAFEKGDYTTAFQLIKPVADRGEPAAQYNMGVLFQNGLGVPQDYTAAVKWYRLAADQGYTLAQNNLGLMFRYGLGVAEDYGEAINWLKLAAQPSFDWIRLTRNPGNADAQFNLGQMFDLGLGVPQNLVEAIKWYRLAADQGSIHAQVNAGYMYMNGLGGPKDYVQAYYWSSLASSISVVPSLKLHTPSQIKSEANAREVATRNKSSVAALMTADQIAEAERLTKEWLAAHLKK